MERFSVVVGDLTESDAEVIVNSAAPDLLGGSGVDGAIHRAAGPALLEECRALGGCETGKVKATSGCKLPVRYIFHTVGPVWQGGQQNEAALLASCYRSCLELAEEKGIERIDFPSISTGVFGYPLPFAATVALKAIMDFLRTHELPLEVRMVCHSEEIADVYRMTYNMWYAVDKAHKMPTSDEDDEEEE